MQCIFTRLKLTWLIFFKNSYPEFHTNLIKCLYVTMVTAGWMQRQADKHSLYTGHSLLLPQDWLGSVHTHLKYIHQYFPWNTQMLAFTDCKVQVINTANMPQLLQYANMSQLIHINTILLSDSYVKSTETKQENAVLQEL
jgi:hypothetical protein